MKVDTRDIRAASHVARNFGQVTDEVEAGSTIVVMRNNVAVSVVAPMSLLERLDALEEREEELRLLSLAFVRSATADGDLVDLNDLATELGIDLDDEH